MAAVKIPKGALVNINSSGYATNATDAASETFAGVAYETVDNSAGNAGDLSIRVQTTGTFVFVDGGGNGAQTDVGVEFNVVDNQTVTDAATSNNLVAGVAVESISATSRQDQNRPLRELSSRVEKLESLDQAQLSNFQTF